VGYVPFRSTVQKSVKTHVRSLFPVFSRRVKSVLSPELSWELVYSLSGQWEFGREGLPFPLFHGGPFRWRHVKDDYVTDSISRYVLLVT
jgi:hypothetical protein